MESRIRTILKTLSWRLVATLITFIIVLLLTEKAELAAGVGLADTLLKLFAYYGHERAWTKLKFGQKRIVRFET